MSRGEKRMKKVKIKTQNDRIVETDNGYMALNIWKKNYLSQEETVQCK